MNWQKLTDTIPHDPKGISRGAAVSSEQVCRLWQDYAAKLLLSGAIQAHEAINFRDGVLTISVTDATHLDAIRAQQRRMIRAINQTLGAGLIRTVRYLI